MKTPRNKYLEAAQGPLFDPFPKPQTMPEGWDLSGLISTESLPAVTQAPNLFSSETD